MKVNEEEMEKVRVSRYLRIALRSDVGEVGEEGEVSQSVQEGGKVNGRVGYLSKVKREKECL